MLMEETYKIMVDSEALTLYFGVKPRGRRQRQTYSDAETNLTHVCFFPDLASVVPGREQRSLSLGKEPVKIL